MKTWEDFIYKDRMSGTRADWAYESINKLDYEAIQLDAYEKGIRDAAEVARKTYAGWEWNFMYQDASQTIGNEIESLLTKPKDKE